MAAGFVTEAFASLSKPDSLCSRVQFRLAVWAETWLDKNMEASLDYAFRKKATATAEHLLQRLNPYWKLEIEIDSWLFPQPRSDVAW